METSVASNNKTLYFDKNDFKLRIIRTPLQVIIEAERKQNYLKQIRSRIFSNLEELYSGLLYGLENKYDDYKIRDQ